MAGRRAREFDASAAAAAAAADPAVALPAQALRARRDDDDARRRHVFAAGRDPVVAAHQLKDFPCALRDFKVAKVTKTCELLCKEATCARALKHCERLVECDAVVVDGQEIKAGHNRDLSKATVRLLRDDAARAAADGSRQILEASKWWGSALKQQTKPRTYIVVSYGGCGSKMLAGWLAQLPRKYAKHVYHFHDKRPPDVLRELPPPPRPSTRERDFRARRFPAAAGSARRLVPSPIWMITACSTYSRTPSRPWCLDLGLATASTWMGIVAWNKVSRNWTVCRTGYR